MKADTPSRQRARARPLFLSLVAFACFAIGTAVHASDQRNFIVIFIDDLGYGDIGPFGSTLNRTPNLDRMAEEGMKLTDFYAAASVCTPSRAALMTGSYAQRVDMGNNALPETGNDLVLFPGEPKGLNPSEITIADLLKDAGYATACIGKWHLGDQPQWLPREHGFDTYFGIPYSNDMGVGNTSWNYPPLPVIDERAVVEQEPDQGMLTKRYNEKALEFIEANQDKPFFLYLPHTMVHLPRFASPAFEGKSNNGLYGDIVEELDWSVGQILDTLKDLKLDERTTVFFFSDNGGTRETDDYKVSNAPLRGRKGSMFEGGLRVCSLAWAPGLIPAGSTSHEIVTSMDLLPTFANLSEGQVPFDRIIDGIDVTRILKGDPKATGLRKSFYYYRASVLYAVRSGPWKLFVKDYRYSGEVVPQGTLYNLRQDIGETTDRSGEFPEVVQRIQTIAAKARGELGDGPDNPGSQVRRAAYIDLEQARTLTERPQPWSKVMRRR
ncbi:MAG: hypothetical protein CBD18_03555 [Opitutales bacterium TMED158]|nr:MAG: hypothetical protein CBD18_03555 [Opitutales bacterium TMED158]